MATGAVGFLGCTPESGPSALWTLGFLLLKLCCHCDQVMNRTHKQFDSINCFRMQLTPLKAQYVVYNSLAEDTITSHSMVFLTHGLFYVKCSSEGKHHTFCPKLRNSPRSGSQTMTQKRLYFRVIVQTS